MHARDKRIADRPAVARGPRGRPAVDTTATHILRLQQSIGNAAVSRLLQRRPRDRPQTTDAPGQRPRPTSPPKQQPKKDIRARVIGVSVEGGMTRITISAGPDQGVAVGMPGYLAGRDGKPYTDFEIAGIKGGTSFAFVQATPDEVSAHSTVVITPSKGGAPPPEEQQF